MATRPYAGVQAIGAASQPVFGTTFTAASVASPSGSPITVQVASTNGIKQNDRVLAGVKANFTPANAALLDQGTVASVVDATHLTIQGLAQNHANGEFLVLNEEASFVAIVPVASVALMYVGNSSTVAAADPSVFDVIGKLSGVAAEPTYWHQSPTTGKGDSYQTSEYWINGTAADTFIARFTQI